MSPRRGNPWLSGGPERPAALVRLLCLPYAGGNASIFRTWTAQFVPEIEVCAVQLPGRQTRFREPALTRMDLLVDQLQMLVAELTDLPLAIFGQCAGALVGFELARRLRNGRSAPVHLFIASCPAPDVCASRPALHTLPEDAFLEELVRMGGTPTDLLAMPELRAFVIPALRADLELFETYAYAPGEPLACPITTFWGTNDTMVSAMEMAPWKGHTSRDVAAHAFEGTHYLLERCEADVLGEIERGLAKHLAPMPVSSRRKGMM